MQPDTKPENIAQIFDPAALKLRQQRAKRLYLDGKSSSPDFLLHHAAKDIAARLSMVSRQFDSAVDVFGRTSAMAKTINAVENVEKISRIEIQDYFADDKDFEVITTKPDMFDLPDELFDLAISAFALHWSGDLPGMLIQIRKILKPDGLFLGILPGPDTLTELRQCLAAAEQEIHGGISPRIDPFVTVQTAGALIQRAGFALPVIDSEKITVRYDTLTDLVKDLRAMSATNVLVARDRSKFSKSLFARAAKIYAARFADADGRIRATFELVSMSGWVPHHSQQKPLKPGSATVHLAKVLDNNKNVP